MTWKLTLLLGLAALLYLAGQAFALTFLWAM